MSTYSPLVIPFNSSAIVAFKQYLSLVNPILTTNKLSPIEINVLGLLIYIDYINRNLTKDKRDLITFSKDSRKRIMRELKISEDSYNNIISSLSKKKYIVRKDNSKRLMTYIPIDINKTINLSYKISITEENNLEFDKTIINDKINDKIDY